MAHTRQAQTRPHSDRRDWQNLKKMIPYLWNYRGRAMIALACLIMAKVANVGIPVVLKGIVDGMENHREALLALPVALLLAYGALRVSSTLFNELRDIVFARVRYHAMRRLATEVMTHLHRLSLGFHLGRQTGAISRDLDRGTRSVSSILNYMVFSIIPMVVEFTLVAGILLSNYDLIFTLVTFGTVAIYVAFTFAVTEWRMDYR
ncbi:MAG: ABC transporter transmembrane domain-containing protein, partial [Sedimenticola sp.]|nr:ABC transporter transmembrane domain-containing protein [Sedimenticola sp.]